MFVDALGSYDFPRTEASHAFYVPLEYGIDHSDWFRDLNFSLAERFGVHGAFFSVTLTRKEDQFEQAARRNSAY